MAAESDGGEVEDVDVSEEVFEVAREYDAALREALDELVEQYPPENDATAYDLWQAQAPYLVLMTLRGEGVGIWDGDWDRFYEDTKPAEKFLKKKLGKFADDSGAGLLNEAFISSADQEGDSDPDEDEDDEDDDEED